MNKKHLFAIDGVRFAAALLVVVYHLAFKIFANPGDDFHRILPISTDYAGVAAGQFGWIGVQVFFVISGFVIAYSVQGETIATYLRRRILRLVPAIWIIVPICMIIALFALQEPVGAVLKTGVRTALFVPIGPWIMGQFWTLPIEIAFYAAVALLLCAKAIDRLELFGVVLGLVSAAYWFADAVVHFPSQGQQLVRLCLLQHGVFFAAGVVIYCAGTKGLTAARSGFLALMATAAFFQIGWAAQWENPGVAPALRTLAPFAIWLALVAVVLLSTLRRPRTPAASNRIQAGVMRLIGLATYPLYLLHYHVGGLILLVALDWGASPLASIVLALVGCVAASLVMAQFAEPALRAWMRRWPLLSDRRSAVARPAGAGLSVAQDL